MKEVKLEHLLPDRNYMFFAHVIKAQDYNMPLLDTLLERNIRHIDYEKIEDDKGRLVAFGRYAGICGACDML